LEYSEFFTEFLVTRLDWMTRVWFLERAGIFLFASMANLEPLSLLPTEYQGLKEQLCLYKRKSVSPAGNRTPAVQLKAHRYTDWAIPALSAMVKIIFLEYKHQIWVSFNKEAKVYAQTVHEDLKATKNCCAFW
jgi:hypothetical protein